MRYECIVGKVYDTLSHSELQDVIKITLVFLRCGSFDYHQNFIDWVLRADNNIQFQHFVLRFKEAFEVVIQGVKKAYEEECEEYSCMIACHLSHIKYLIGCEINIFTKLDSFEEIKGTIKEVRANSVLIELEDSLEELSALIPCCFWKRTEGNVLVVSEKQLVLSNHKYYVNVADLTQMSFMKRVLEKANGINLMVKEPRYCFGSVFNDEIAFQQTVNLNQMLDLMIQSELNVQSISISSMMDHCSFQSDGRTIDVTRIQHKISLRKFISQALPMYSALVGIVLLFLTDIDFFYEKDEALPKYFPRRKVLTVC